MTSSPYPLCIIIIQLFSLPLPSDPRSPPLCVRVATTGPTPTSATTVRVTDTNGLTTTTVQTTPQENTTDQTTPQENTTDQTTPTLSTLPLLSVGAWVGVGVAIAVSVLLLVVVLLVVYILYTRGAKGFYRTHESNSNEPSMLHYSASLRQLSSEVVSLNKEPSEMSWPHKNGEYSNGVPPSLSPNRTSIPSSDREKEFYL